MLADGRRSVLWRQT